MIKFFRKIRQKLLSENKFSKYLIYAIGEIILVVIGILIALGINNWNQNIQKNEQEKVYYCKIKEDLETDKNNIKASIESLNERKSTAKRVLANLYAGVNNKSDIMKDYLPAIRSYNFVPSKLAIQDITSSGKLENLKKTNLKALILKHYTEMEFALNTINFNRIDVSQYVYRYENLADFGLHQTPLYKDEFGVELLEQMPDVNWHNDKEHLIYKQFQEHITLSIIVSSREQQLLNQILSSTEKLKSKLEKYCE